MVGGRWYWYQLGRRGVLCSIALVGIGGLLGMLS